MLCVLRSHNIHVPFLNMKIHPKLTPCYGIFSKGLKSEFETAVVNKPSVFEPLKYYSSLCNLLLTLLVSVSLLELFLLPLTV